MRKYYEEEEYGYPGSKKERWDKDDYYGASDFTKYPIIEPMLPKPSRPVRDLGLNLVGEYHYHPSSREIRPLYGGSGPTYTVDSIGMEPYVRDVGGRIIGQIGPLGLITPPRLPYSG